QDAPRVLRAAEAELLQRARDLLRLPFLELDPRDDHDLAVAELREERRLRRAPPRLHRHRVAVVARDRPEDRAAAAPDRRAPRARARAARALLPPRLLVREGELRARPRLVRADALVRLVHDARLVDEARAHLP